MATLWITEGKKLRQGNVSQIVELPAVAEQTVAIGGTSAQPSAFNAQTGLIRINTDANCHILVGADPTATTAKTRLAAGQSDTFAVTPGQKIAVIAGV